jgi:hypothetical protein
MKKVISTAIAIAMMTSYGFAAGATLSDLGGKVLVNKGDGFKSVVGAIELNTGDRVMVGEDSFATLTYSECAVSLAKPGVVAISDVAPCDVVVTPTADYVAPAGGVAGLPIPLLVIGTAAVVGTVILVAEPFKKKKSSPGPVSPP